MTDEILFKVATPDGHVFTFTEGGQVSGFPAGSIIFNRAPAVINARVADALRKQAPVDPELYIRDWRTGLAPIDFIGPARL